MTNLYQAAAVSDLKARLALLRPDSQRQWGKMNPAQALAHCSAGLEMAVDEIRLPRVFIGRILGPLIKPFVVRKPDPLRRNSPTAERLIVSGDRDFNAERDRLGAMIDRFAAAGPAGCTRHPHPFFGRLTPEEWATLMHKHLDHHLRQFGV